MLTMERINELLDRRFEEATAQAARMELAKQAKDGRELQRFTEWAKRQEPPPKRSA